MLLLALLLQVGPNPLAGGLPDDALVRERPARPARSDTPGEAEGAAKAAINPTSAWLEDCFDQIAADPARAHAMAQIRREETRGADRVLANHCLGTAAAELGRWDEARAAFAAALGETPPGEPRLRAMPRSPRAMPKGRLPCWLPQRPMPAPAMTRCSRRSPRPTVPARWWRWDARVRRSDRSRPPPPARPNAARAGY